MPRPRLKLPTKKRSQRPKIGRRLPDKVGRVKHIYNAGGDLLMVGTEAEWRNWIKTRR
jgi:hypothetical protein